MIRSMTGFASVTREDEVSSVGVTLKAVNHRYLDVQVRAPQIVGPFEAAVRARVQRRISRGRVELSISVQFRRPADVEVELNRSLLTALAGSIDRAREAGLVAGPLVAGDLLRLPQALTIRERAAGGSEQDMAAVQHLVLATTEAAVEELDQMRTHEGIALRADLEARRCGLARSVDSVACEAARGVASLQDRLARRVNELKIDAGLEPALIAQEIVRMASRSDISEELVRFRAHLDHWATLADGPEPCGRKLDFLLQEMNREINTIGSKAEGARVSELIVHVKAELERMREQVQNVE
jgi:uncharacterized protein (TIGR00255 family)